MPYKELQTIYDKVIAKKVTATAFKKLTGYTLTAIRVDDGKHPRTRRKPPRAHILQVLPVSFVTTSSTWTSRSASSKKRS